MTPLTARIVGLAVRRSMRRSVVLELKRKASLPVVIFALSGVTDLHAGVEDRDWCITSTSHFDLVSDLKSSNALALLGSLHRFRSASLALLPSGRLAPAPVPKLLVFERRRDFRKTFKSTAMVGFTRSSLDQSLLASGPDRTGQLLHRNVFHEYTHYLIRSHAELNLPIWYEEGLASYLSTLSVDSEGLAVVGRVPYEYLRGALVAPGASITDVVGERFRMGADHHEMSGTYGLAWALVRFLHHAKAPDGTRYASRLGQMLSNIDNGSPGIDALRSMLDMDPADLGMHLKRYYQNDRLPVYRFRTPVAEKLPFHRQCLGPVEARYELAEAAAFRNRQLAFDLYGEIVDEDPTHIGGLIGLSRLARGRRSLELAERAHGVDSDDPAANVRLAELLVANCRRGWMFNDNDAANLRARPVDTPRGEQRAAESLTESCGPNLQRAITLYRRAIDSPSHAGAAAYGLGIASLLTRQWDDALTSLRAAYLRAPWSPQVNFYLGEAYRRTGDSRQAIRHFTKTVNWHPEQSWRDRAERALASISR